MLGCWGHCGGHDWDPTVECSGTWAKYAKGWAGHPAGASRACHLSQVPPARSFSFESLSSSNPPTFSPVRVQQAITAAPVAVPVFCAAPAGVYPAASFRDVHSKHAATHHTEPERRVLRGGGNGDAASGLRRRALPLAPFADFYRLPGFDDGGHHGAHPPPAASALSVPPARLGSTPAACWPRTCLLLLVPATQNATTPFLTCTQPPAPPTRRADGGTVPPQRGHHPRGCHHQPRPHPGSSHRMRDAGLLCDLPQQGGCACRRRCSRASVFEAWVCIVLHVGAVDSAASRPPPMLQDLKGKQHFTSLHGKVGLVTFLLALASPLLGVLSFRRLGLIQKFPQDWHPRLKWLHRLVRAEGHMSAHGDVQVKLPSGMQAHQASCALSARDPAQPLATSDAIIRATCWPAGVCLCLHPGHGDNTAGAAPCGSLHGHVVPAVAGASWHRAHVRLHVLPHPALLSFPDHFPSVTAGGCGCSGRLHAFHAAGAHQRAHRAAVVGRHGGCRISGAQGPLSWACHP